MTLPNEEVRWRVAQTFGDHTISTVRFNAVIAAPAGTTGTYSQLMVNRFPVATTNDAEKSGIFGTADYYGWFDLWGPSNLSTNQIILESVGAGGPNTGGTIGNAPLRQTSQGVVAVALGAISSPDLPVLATGGFYKVLAFNSPDGQSIMFTAANTSGYGLFAVSSPNLVDDDNGDPVLDPSTTLNPVFLDGSQTAGAYNGSNKDLVLRADSGGQPLLLTGYSYSAVPAGLPTLSDGQSVTMNGDAIADGSDMLWLTCDDGSASHGFVLVPSTSSQPQITITDTTVTEGGGGGGGGGGTTSVPVTISLSAAAASTVTVDFGTVSGAATEGSDFTGANGTVTFLPGETTETITVPVIGDNVYEPNEDFFLALSSATNAVIADDVGMITVQNDDDQPTISIGDVTQNEGNSGTTSFVFTVTLSNPSWQTITVDFATADDSATAGSDYAAAGGTLTFLPGETTKTITITVYGDTTPEPQLAQFPNPPGEGFFVNLSAPTNAGLVDAQGLGWISNDDSGL